MKIVCLFLVLVSFQTFAATKTCLCFGISDDNNTMAMNDEIYAYEYERHCDSYNGECWNVDESHKLFAANEVLETQMKKYKHNEAICFNGSQGGGGYQVLSLATPTAKEILDLACGKKLR